MQNDCQRGRGEKVINGIDPIAQHLKLYMRTWVLGIIFVRETMEGAFCEPVNHEHTL